MHKGLRRGSLLRKKILYSTNQKPSAIERTKDGVEFGAKCGLRKVFSMTGDTKSRRTIKYQEWTFYQWRIEVIW